MVGDGRGQEVTPAQLSKAKVTPAECAAMKLLYHDGYSEKQVAKALEVSPSTVHRHVSEQCRIHAIPNYND